MKRAGTSEGKLTGLYRRGKTFWFTYRLNGKKHFHSLGTADYGEAVQKALEIRQTPELAPAAVFSQEIDAFVRAKVAANEYSPRSAGTNIHALRELATVTGRANPVSVTTADVTKFYRWLQSRVQGRTRGKVAESTAQGKKDVKHRLRLFTGNKVPDPRHHLPVVAAGEKLGLISRGSGQAALFRATV